MNNTNRLSAEREAEIDRLCVLCDRFDDLHEPDKTYKSGVSDRIYRRDVRDLLTELDAVRGERNSHLKLTSELLADRDARIKELELKEQAALFDKRTLEAQVKKLESEVEHKTLELKAHLKAAEAVFNDMRDRRNALRQQVKELESRSRVLENITEAYRKFPYTDRPCRDMMLTAYQHLSRDVWFLRTSDGMMLVQGLDKTTAQTLERWSREGQETPNYIGVINCKRVLARLEEPKMVPAHKLGLFPWFRCKRGEHDKCIGIDMSFDDDCTCDCHNKSVVAKETCFVSPINSQICAYGTKGCNKSHPNEAI